MINQTLVDLYKELNTSKDELVWNKTMISCGVEGNRAKYMYRVEYLTIYIEELKLQIMLLE